jgi:hypothetical protein
MGITINLSHMAVTSIRWKTDVKKKKLRLEPDSLTHSNWRIRLAIPLLLTVSHIYLSRLLASQDWSNGVTVNSLILLLQSIPRLCWFSPLSSLSCFEHFPPFLQYLTPHYNHLTWIIRTFTIVMTKSWIYGIGYNTRPIETSSNISCILFFRLLSKHWSSTRCGGSSL